MQQQLQNCEKHASSKKERYCKTCLLSVCQECISESHKDHTVISYADLQGEIRSTKDRIMVTRIGGISARKGLMQELDKLLKQVDSRQSRLQDEARSIEQELPKTLKAMAQTVASQKEEIAQRIKEIQLSISTSREMLINDLQTVSDQAEALLQGTDAGIKEFIQTYQDKNAEGSEVAEFRAKLKDITSITASYENFSPYDYFKELANLYSSSDAGVTFERLVKVYADTSPLTYYNSSRQQMDASFTSSNSSLHTQSASQLVHNPEVTLAAMSKRLESILAKHALPVADRTLEGMLQSVEKLCDRPVSAKPNSAVPVIKKDALKEKKGATKLLVAAKKQEKKSSTTLLGATRLKLPKGTIGEEEKATPRPAGRNAMAGISSKKSVAPTSPRKKPLASYYHINYIAYRKERPERTGRSLKLGNFRSKSIDRPVAPSLGLHNKAAAVAKKAKTLQTKPEPRVSQETIEASRRLVSELRSAVGGVASSLKVQSGELSGTFFSPVETSRATPVRDPTGTSTGGETAPSQQQTRTTSALPPRRVLRAVQTLRRASHSTCR